MENSTVGPVNKIENYHMIQQWVPTKVGSRGDILYTHVHNHIIHNSQETEASQVSNIR